MNKCNFASKEESNFAEYLEELKELGHIEYWYFEPVSFKLFDYNKEYKLRKHIYTPDFKIKWIDDFYKLLHIEAIEGISFIEIKPAYDKYNMTRLFKLNQKWVYSLTDIYVQLIIPTKLFDDTFTPLKIKRRKKTIRYNEFVKTQDN